MQSLDSGGDVSRTERAVGGGTGHALADVEGVVRIECAVTIGGGCFASGGEPDASARHSFSDLGRGERDERAALVFEVAWLFSRGVCALTPGEGELVDGETFAVALERPSILEAHVKFEYLNHFYKPPQNFSSSPSFS